MGPTRNTVQRDIILKTVNSMHNHPTAEDVYNAVICVDPHISKGTVYRNLALLSAAGQIRKIAMPGTDPDRYDFNLSQHYHAVCRKCGRIIDVYGRGGKPDVQFSEDFMIEDIDLVFSGLCANCCN